MCARCKCDGNFPTCIPLCAPIGVKCPPGFLLGHKKKPVPGAAGCACDIPVCRNPNTCEVNGNTYKKGERFIMRCMPCHCGGFDSIGRVSQCPPMWAKCEPDEVEVTVKEMTSPGCYCPRPKCVKKNKEFGIAVEVPE